MLNRIKYWLILPAGLVLWLFIKSCGRPEPVLTQPIPPTDVLRVGVTDRVITVQTGDGAETAYVPDNGRVVVTVNKEGDVDLTVKNKGFTFNPVLGVNVSEHLGLAAGAQLAYWNRLELYGGLIAPRWAGFAGLGFRLDQIKLKNTSVYVSYSTRKEIGAGLLLRF